MRRLGDETFIVCRLGDRPWGDLLRTLSASLYKSNSFFLRVDRKFFCRLVVAARFNLCADRESLDGIGVGCLCVDCMGDDCLGKVNLDVLIGSSCGLGDGGLGGGGLGDGGLGNCGGTSCDLADLGELEGELDG